MIFISNLTPTTYKGGKTPKQHPQSQLGEHKTSAICYPYIQTTARGDVKECEEQRYKP
jgi:hypothetical protein